MHSPLVAIAPHLGAMSERSQISDEAAMPLLESIVMSVLTVLANSSKL